MSDHSPEIFKSRDFQELFDMALNGVVTQGCASVAKAGGACLYTDHMGNHCGVGHTLTETAQELIGDEEFDVDGVIEMLTFQAGYHWDTHNTDNIRTIDFLQEMQKAHDDAQRGLTTAGSNDIFLHRFKVNMFNVAQKHKLDAGVANDG